MIAFDTNLLVRLAVNDNPQQAEIAEQLLNNHRVFISRTVLLETEWVLRSIYKKSRSDIAAFFQHAFITENLVFENSAEIKQALEWYGLGSDFADAIHLSMCTELLLHTFDTKFCKTAKQLGKTPPFKILA